MIRAGDRYLDRLLSNARRVRTMYCVRKLVCHLASGYRSTTSVICRRNMEAEDANPEGAASESRCDEDSLMCTLKDGLNSEYMQQSIQFN